MIETWNLTKKFGTLTAVDNLNLSIARGELFTLLGLNGAGKTTTIKILSCLIRPSGGFVGIPLSVKLVYTFLSFIPFVLFSGFFGIFPGIICREMQVMAGRNIKKRQ